MIVEFHPLANAVSRFAAVRIGFQVNLLYLIERHSRSMKMLSMKRPRPSIEIAILAASSLPVNTVLVNCAPWSVLNIRGLPYFCKASFRASTHNELSIVFDSRQASTARLAQSMIATR